MDTRIDLSARLATLTALAPGAGAMILHRQEPPTLVARGVRIAGRAGPVTIDDPWHIGSCTKAMTATLLARLQAKGLVDLGSGLGEALSDIAMHPAFAAMTLHDVLRHRAGIRRDPHWSVFARLRASRAPIRAQRHHLASIALAERPQVRTGYSNLGYIVLGAVVEAATGLTWEHAMIREVFAPLGMAGASFGAPPLPAPVGHMLGEGRWRPKPPGPFADNPRLYGPAGRVHLPLGDWARFAAVHLGTGASGYLPLSLLNECHRSDPGGYAAGWGADIAPDGISSMLRHTGSNTLWFADIRLVPSAGVGIATVCNADSVALRHSILKWTDTVLHDIVMAK